jgi:uncharacterized membrane protein
VEAGKQLGRPEDQPHPGKTNPESTTSRQGHVGDCQGMQGWHWHGPAHCPRNERPPFRRRKRGRVKTSRPRPQGTRPLPRPAASSLIYLGSTRPGHQRGVHLRTMRFKVTGGWRRLGAAGAGDQLRRPRPRCSPARPLRGLGMIGKLIHIALITAKAVLALIATILIVPGLGIVGTLWYMRRWRARKLRPQIALEALNQRYALGDIGRTEYLQNRDDILSASTPIQSTT